MQSIAAANHPRDFFMMSILQFSIGVETDARLGAGNCLLYLLGRMAGEILGDFANEHG